MFDPITATFLRTAPAMPGLDPAAMPQMLTARYAELVARRLCAIDGEPVIEPGENTWPLGRIADAYELITSIHGDEATRRAAAFVAGTAQQILAQEALSSEAERAAPILDRDRVDPTLAAPILFLAAEQYADAIEAGRRITVEGRTQSFVATLLAESIQDLAAGNLASILDRARRRSTPFVALGDLETRATAALFDAILAGVELFAANALAETVPDTVAGRFELTARGFQDRHRSRHGQSRHG